MHPGGIEGGEFIFGVETNIGDAEVTKKRGFILLQRKILRKL